MKLLSLLGLTLCVSCLPGPEDLVEQSDLHVTVTGASSGEQVTLSIAASTWTQTATRGQIDFFVQASARGEIGLLADGRAPSPRCQHTPYDLSVQSSFSFDLSSFVPCDQSATRLFESAFFERLKEGSCESDCLERTEVNARGDVYVTSNDGEMTYMATAESLAELITAIVSEDADTLFAGECEGMPLGNNRRVGRTLRIENGVVDTFVDEDVELRACGNGVHGLINSAFAGLKPTE